ncbi:MAG TPA: type II toxin-antitoxin system VapC family toxin [Conexibacter sp.]|nr:type II toxin-antitoxin system VapC family toxin [Conexibacter sp.]
MLDSWAVLAWLRDEPSGGRVLELLERDEQLISSVNLGEVLCWTIRDRGEERALAIVRQIREAVRVEDPDWQLTTEAARVKARGGISYADAFCVATARRHRLPVYTGDPEILALDGDDLAVVDLRARP